MFAFFKKLLGLPDSVSPAEAQALVKSGDAVLLDVRSAGERKAAHIAGSLHIPVDELGARASSLPKNKTIICQCASGMRSASAAKQLAAAGYKTLNLSGGIGAWQGAGSPVK